MAYDWDKRTSVADTTTFTDIDGQWYEHIITKDRKKGKQRLGGGALKFYGSDEIYNGNEWQVSFPEEGDSKKLKVIR